MCALHTTIHTNTKKSEEVKLSKSLKCRLIYDIVNKVLQSGYNAYTHYTQYGIYFNANLN